MAAENLLSDVKLRSATRERDGLYIGDGGGLRFRLLAPSRNHPRGAKLAEFHFKLKAPGGSYRNGALHLGTLGLGVGYGNLLLATVAYTPRLCVGAAAGETAVGLRHGLSVHFIGMLLSLELAHQLLHYSSGVLANELQLTVGANLGSLFLLLSPFR